ncbi:MAG: hypothetical protein Q9168_003941 [Polycauliona sp. 1 TL-2023]
MVYGESTEMVQQGHEVNGLITEWHQAFTLGGLVASLPWLINPLIHNPLFKKYLMPSKRQDWGSGHIMLNTLVTREDVRPPTPETITSSPREHIRQVRTSEPRFTNKTILTTPPSFLKTKDPKGQPLSLQSAEYECFVFTVGAQDTTAAFMSAFIDHMLREPQVKARLHDEIDQFHRLGKLSSPTPTYAETTALPYFMACCQETLRLSPSVSMVLPRYASPGGMFIGTTWIPDQTEISANPYVLHRDKHVFGDDAETFNPDRWLGDSTRMRKMEKYFFAFGYGSRKCIGRHLAVFEAQKFFVRVSRRLYSFSCLFDDMCEG